MADGVLNINKPSGMTSFAVVATVRKLTGCRRVGHAGTLDPDATGVLLVCLGRATRMSSIMADTTKTYRADLRLGVSTDTYDASGNIVRECDPSLVTREEVERALEAFRGTIQQVPPAYSAIKVQGRPLYELARRGEPVQPPVRTVEVFRIEAVDWAPPVVGLEIDCGKGTYIRSIASDLGRALGCGAHVTRLERTRSGFFSIADSVTLPELRHACESGCWETYLQPVDSGAMHLKAAILSKEQTGDMRNGRTIRLPLGTEYQPGKEGKPVLQRAYSSEGEFIGIIQFEPEKDVWHPAMVVSRGEPDRDADLGRCGCGRCARKCEY